MLILKDVELPCSFLLRVVFKSCKLIDWHSWLNPLILHINFTHSSKVDDLWKVTKSKYKTPGLTDLAILPNFLSSKAFLHKRGFTGSVSQYTPYSFETFPPNQPRAIFFAIHE